MRRRIGLAHKAVSLAVSVLLVAGTVLGNVSVAYAADTDGGSAQSTATGEPTVVRELTDERTETSRTYLMSDGSKRAEVYTAPVFARDDAGAMVPVDASLEASDAPDTFTTVASPVDVTLRTATATSAPVTVTRNGVTATIDMLGAFERLGFVLDDTAVYSGLQVGTDLVYETAPQGIKETVYLASPASPRTLSFRLALDGGQLAQIPGAGLAVFKGSEPLPVFSIGRLSVVDASGTACPDATTQVTPSGESAYTVTYEIPQTWLDEPERTFPVAVDPSLLCEQDTYVSSANPTGNFSQAAELYVGQPATGNHNRALMRFDADFLKGAYCKDATLQVDASYMKVTTGSRTYLDRIDDYWTSNYTWNTKPAYVPVTSQLLYNTGWYYFDVRDTVQSWADRSVKWWYSGLQLRQAEDGSQGTNHYKRFYSDNSANPPKIMLNYSVPSVTTTTDASSYDDSGADLVTATAVVNSAYAGDVRTFEMTVNGAEKGVLRKRAAMRWSDTTPTAEWDSWVKCSGSTGYFAYRSADPTSAAEPVLASCVNSTSGSAKTLTFAFKVKPGWGDIQSNSVDYRMTMGPAAGTATFDTGWRAGASSFDVQPAAVSPSFTTTASADWFTETTDSNSDGFADNPNNDNTAGRGAVSLSWQPRNLAAGYDIYLFDGNVYRLVGTTSGRSSTTWSSAGKGLFPSDAWISSHAASLTAGASPFLTAATGGLDLRDDPRALYRATPGTTYDELRGYYFKVVPCATSSGDGDVAGAQIVGVGLDDRTVGLNDDAQATTIDLGETHGGQASLDASTGALTLDVTDLSINSYGPVAELSRHYDSSKAGTGAFGGGWRFNFEQKIAVGSTVATYTDEAGDTHRFVNRSGTWYAPAGFVGQLSANGSGWKITQPDGSGISFDSVGDLASEFDHVGNTVTYAKVGSDVEIRAANGVAKIVVSRSGSTVTGAKYETASGWRSMSYTSASSTMTATSSYSDSTTGVAQAYGYASGKLTRIAAPGIATTAGAGVWDVAYSSGKVSAFTGPEYNGTNRAVATVTYQASPVRVSIERSGAQVEGASAPVFEHWWLNPTGTLAKHAELHSPDTTTEAATTYTYSPDGYEQSEAGPLGARSSSLLDAHGNTLRTRDQDGAETRSIYDAFDRVTSSVDERGATTWSYYDAAGNLSVQESQLNSTERSHVGYAYDSRGRKTSETTSLTATTASITEYAYEAGIDDPTSTTKHVTLAYGAPRTTLVSTVDFDAFGAPLASTDASGAQTTNAYDGAGRLVRSTGPADAAGARVTENHAFDAFGNETAVWRSATGTSTVTGYTTKDTDAYGRVRTETICDGAYEVAGASAHPVSTTTHAFDSLGREITSHASLTGGLAALTYYDAAGNATKSWSDGLPDHADARATRTTYDLVGNNLTSLDPGESAATCSTYAPSGRVASQTSAEGVTTTYKYNAAGDEISTTSGDEGTTISSYDLAGRLLVRTEDVATDVESTTEYTYDLAGRQVTAIGGGGVASTSVFNEEGQTLQATDADGIVSQTAYDAAGRTVSESVAGSETVTSYDAAGRMSSQIGPAPELRAQSVAYDVFGRAVETSVTSAKGVVSQVRVSYDALDRPVATNDLKTGVSRTFTYATTPGARSIQTVTYAGVTTTRTVAADGLEKSQQVSAAFLAAPLTRSVTATDAASRPTNWTISVGAGAMNASASFETTSGRLASLATKNMTLSMAYEAGTGRRIKDAGGINGNGALGANYSYSDQGRLSNSTAGGASRAYAFDSAGNGNIVSATATDGAQVTLAYGGAGCLASTKRNGVTTTYGWDASRGWRTSSRRSGETSVTYTFTAESRLAGFSNPNGGGTYAAYDYDATGQRTSSAVTSTAGFERTAWVYDGLKLLSYTTTRTPTASVTTPTAVWQVTYLYDSADRPWAGVYREGTSTLSATANGTPFAIDATDRGDVVGLTDKDGSSFARYRYDSWGNPVDVVSLATSSTPAATASNIADRQVLRYAGYCWDRESRMYYCSARAYDPATMQFISKDPAKADGEESAYQYCGGEPVGNVDPTGAYAALTKSATMELTAYHWQPWWFSSGSATGSMIVDNLGQVRFGNHLHVWMEVYSLQGNAYRIHVHYRCAPVWMFCTGDNTPLSMRLFTADAAGRDSRGAWVSRAFKNVGSPWYGTFRGAVTTYTWNLLLPRGPKRLRWVRLHALLNDVHYDVKELYLHLNCGGGPHIGPH